MKTVKLYQLTLTERDLKNLSILLSRVELKGSEIPAYINISKALANSRAFNVSYKEFIKTEQNNS